VEVGENYVVMAQVSTTFGKPVEMRTKVKLQPQATSKAPAANKKSDSKSAKMGNKKSKKGSKSEPKTATAVEPDEPTEIMVGEHKLVCEVKKDGKSTVWTCPDVPFDGIVKIDRPNYKFELVDFAWKK
jgi:hypothetical protein